MTDPTRLLDDPSAAKGRSLIQAWSHERPSADARTRTLGALGLMTAPSIAAGAVPGSPAAGAAATPTTVTAGAAGGGGALTSAKVALAKWIFACAVVGTVSAAAVAVVSHSTSERARENSVAVQPAPSASTIPAPAIAADPPPIRSITVDDLPSAPSAHARIASASPTDRVQAGSDRSDLEAIDRARETMRSDPRRALGLLDALEQAHPNGAYADEATVMRVDALVAIGDSARASELARAFVARRPTSPYAVRMGRIASKSIP